MNRFLVILVLLIVPPPITADESKNLPMTGEVVKRAIDSRNAIRSLHLHAQIDTLLDAEDKSERSVAYEVWWDGDHYRTDYTVIADTERAKDVNVRTTICRNCERSGYSVWMARGPKLVSTVEFHKMDEAWKKADKGGFDWRYLGLSNDGTEKDKPFAWLETLQKVKESPFASVTTEGSKIIFQKIAKGRTHLRWEFDKSAGGNPILTRFQEIEHGEVQFEQSTQSTLQQDKPTGIWFPTKVVFQCISKGKKYLQQSVTIESVEFNQPISPDIFTLSTMDIMSNTPIHLPELKNKSYAPTWQNGKIDPSKPLNRIVQESRQLMMAKTDPIPDQRKPFWSQNWPFVAAVLLAILGIYFYLKRSAQKRVTLS